MESEEGNGGTPVDSHIVSGRFYDLDQRVKTLYEQRRTIDEELAPLVWRIWTERLFREGGFVNFGDYCQHRFNRPTSWAYHVTRNIRLRLEAPKALQEAEKRGEVPPTKARDVSALVQRGVVKPEDAVRVAKEKTSKQLAEMWKGSAAPTEFTARIDKARYDSLVVPVMEHLRRCFLEGDAFTNSNVLEALCAEYIGGHPEVWAVLGDWPEEIPKPKQIEILDRDGWMCRHPKCDSARNLQAHHVLPRARYPEYIEETWNLIVLCAFHHERVLTSPKATIREGQFRLTYVDRYTLWEFDDGTKLRVLEKKGPEVEEEE